jgi:hypothetical protein
MHFVEYVSIAIAVAVIAVRVVMFFPRSGKVTSATSA